MRTISQNNHRRHTIECKCNDRWCSAWDRMGAINRNDIYSPIFLIDHEFQLFSALIIIAFSLPRTFTRNMAKYVRLLWWFIGWRGSFHFQIQIKVLSTHRIIDFLFLQQRICVPIYWSVWWSDALQLLWCAIKSVARKWFAVALLCLNNSRFGGGDLSRRS